MISVTSRLNRARPCGFGSAFLTLLCVSAACGAEPESVPEGLKLTTPAIPETITGAMRRVNEKISKEIVPAENAGVYLVQILGTEAFEPDLRTKSLSMLGIERVEKTGKRFVYPEPYVNASGDLTPEEAAKKTQELQVALVSTSERMWKADDAPAVADFLKHNEKPLDALVAAAAKPRYFIPMLSNSDPPRLISASLVIERRLPYLARILASRALLRAGSDDFAGASSDLLACHRLARLLASGSPFDVSGAQAYIIDSYACRAEFVLIEGGKLTAEQATGYREALAALPPLLSAAKSADIGERSIVHQELEILQEDKSELAEFFELTEKEKEEKLPAIKWDLVRKEADAVQDRIVAALSTRDRKAQEELFHKLDEAYNKWEEASHPNGKEAPPLPKDIEVASRAIGETMAMSLRPLHWKRRESEYRARVRGDMVQIGLALIAARRAEGEFPARLADLAPKYLKPVPADAFSDVPFTYERSAPDRARLISWGANKTNDEGNFFNDDMFLEVR